MVSTYLWHHLELIHAAWANEEITDSEYLRLTMETLALI